MCMYSRRVTRPGITLHVASLRAGIFIFVLRMRSAAHAEERLSCELCTGVALRWCAFMRDRTHHHHRTVLA